MGRRWGYCPSDFRYGSSSSPSHDQPACECCVGEGGVADRFRSASDLAMMSSTWRGRLRRGVRCFETMTSWCVEVRSGLLAGSPLLGVALDAGRFAVPGALERVELFSARPTDGDCGRAARCCKRSVDAVTPSPAAAGTVVRVGFSAFLVGSRDDAIDVKRLIPGCRMLLFCHGTSR